ncbi:MAG: LpxI family protein [Desulfobacteraceae bacterium]|nr:LpxI family protein [Desulfobacteraceae bacterium]
MNIGLIAGGGQFPILFSQRAVQKGLKVFATAFVNEADQQLEEYVQAIQWQHLGQLSKLIKFFKENDVSQAVMLGSVKKTNIFKDIKPDLKALGFIAKTGITHDDSILSSFADLLSQNGIEVKPSTFLLPELICKKGCWTKRKPDKAEKKDIACGWKLAKEIGKLDIGQCIVISNGTVLAVEAIDGTDSTIKRGGALSLSNGAVVVKLSKPGQDLRFDLPSTGSQTILSMKESGATVLAIEAGKTITFDKKEMIALADQHKICIIALNSDDMK